MQIKTKFDLYVWGGWNASIAMINPVSRGFNFLHLLYE